jgi:hypothetical protein
MSKPLFVCSLCAEDFTRRSSAERHRNNIHEGKSLVVRFLDYLVGRASGLYPKPNDPPRLSRIGRPQFVKVKNRGTQLSATTGKTVADSTTKDLWWRPGSDANNNQFETTPHLHVLSNQAANESTDPLYQSVKFAQSLLQFTMVVDQLYAHSNPLQNIYLPVTHLMDGSRIISKPVGFRGQMCTVCCSGKIDPIFSLDRLESLVTVDHTCIPQELNKIQNMANILSVRSRFHDFFMNSFAQFITTWVRSDQVFLIAEELLPPCSALSLLYQLVKIIPFFRQRILSRDAHIDLGKVSNKHWAHRAIEGQGYKIVLSKEELADFLSLTKSTFGAFQVELEDGSRHYSLIYIN